MNSSELLIKARIIWKGKDNPQQLAGNLKEELMHRGPKKVGGSVLPDKNLSIEMHMITADDMIIADKDAAKGYAYDQIFASFSAVCENYEHFRVKILEVIQE